MKILLVSLVYASAFVLGMYLGAWIEAKVRHQLLVRRSNEKPVNPIPDGGEKG